MLTTRMLTWAAAVVLAARIAIAAEPPEPKPDADVTESNPAEAAKLEAKLLTGTRQLTFEGRRAGEGYFSRDGKQIVFQSEREAGNPFFQIYTLDLETGDEQRISPGHGKTTCAWIHPDGKSVLFASTHDDPDAKKKQQEEIDARAAGQQKRYAWDYDEHFEIYVFDRNSGEYANMTKTRGYDAEGSWSPDGKLIAFSSNRRGYGDDLTADEKKNFEIDPAYLNDIYLMNADGADVRRLTTAAGYDGGPFFSPDGKRICWRRFSPDGAIAEVWTMNLDGSDQRQLTRLGAMSWAPFYHPTGEYLIFTTNRHGFANFELYLVDVEGKSQPVRVTYTKGFDGLPVFTPDGRRMAWTTNRTESGQSQLFIADWNHEEARRLLGMDMPEDQLDSTAAAAARQAAVETARKANVDFAPEDIGRHVDYLCRPDLAGRLTGTVGEKLATAYVAAYFDSLGLQPAGDDGGWFQEFEFTAGVDLGKQNRLTLGEIPHEVGKDWLPLAFAQTGDVAAAPIVFAGYGIAAPKEEGREEYDSFVHLDVKDKWVMVLRFLPEGIPAEQRQALSRFASLRFKAMLVRDKGARGLIVVSGPNSQVKDQIVPLRFDGSLSGSSIPVISLSDKVANDWLIAGGSVKTLKQLQDELDKGEAVMGFPLKNLSLSASIDIERVKRTGRNVLGRLPAGDKPSEQTLLIGAHVDHLGQGANAGSLARDNEQTDIHFGADDNASGVAAMLEVAEYLSDLKRQGQWQPRRDILFAAWSGEELGLIGSSHFAKTLREAAGNKNHHGGTEARSGDEVNEKKEPEGKEPGKKADEAAHHPAADTLYPAIAACLNMDMVGRLDKKLILQGVGSSTIWRGEIERRNVPVGLPITLQDDSYLPTDASTFFMHGVPILSAFTGSHAEYHTPRDTPDTLNYEGAARVSRLMGLIARSLATRETPPDYVAQAGPNPGERRAVLRAYLGTIPDYAESDVKGLKLSGVAKNGPAAKGGMQAGDVIVELAGKKVENIYDYTYAIEALKIGQPVKIVISRNGKRVELQVVPGSRE